VVLRGVRVIIMAIVRVLHINWSIFIIIRGGRVLIVRGVRVLAL
jgi:hypothetical protein